MSKFAEEVCLAIGGFRGTPLWLGRWCEPSHQRQHLNVMRMDVHQRRAFIAPTLDRAAAIHIRVESRVARTLSAPANAADLEHPYYYARTIYGCGSGGRAGVETRGTTPLTASSIDTLWLFKVNPTERSY